MAANARAGTKPSDTSFYSMSCNLNYCAAALETTLLARRVRLPPVLQSRASRAFKMIAVDRLSSVEEKSQLQRHRLPRRKLVCLQCFRMRPQFHEPHLPVLSLAGFSAVTARFPDPIRLRVRPAQYSEGVPRCHRCSHDTKSVLVFFPRLHPMHRPRLTVPESSSWHTISRFPRVRYRICAVHHRRVSGIQLFRRLSSWLAA
jgi:hypothetical protein